MTGGIGGLGDPDKVSGIDSGTYEVAQPGSTQQQQEDQIQASDDIAALLYMMPAKFPILEEPNYNDMDLAGLASKEKMLTEFLGQAADMQSEAVQSVLDAWVEQLQEAAQRTREWLQSPAYQVWLQNKFPDLDSAWISKQVEIQSSVNLIRADAADAIRTASANGQLPNEMSATLLGGMMAGGGIAVDTAQLLPNTIGESMAVVKTLVSNELLAAQLGYIGGMLLAGVGTRAAVGAIMGGLQKGRVNERMLAQDFSERVLDMVRHRGFEAHILSRVVGHIPGAKVMSDAEMVSTIKIIMLANAIAAMKKSEEGWLGPKMGELLAQGQKALDLPESSTLYKLYGEIGGEINKLSPDNQKKILGALDDYFESEPSLSMLTDVSRTFEAIALRIPQTDIADK